MKNLLLASVLSGVVLGCASTPVESIEVSEAVDNSKYGDNWTSLRKGVLICASYYETISGMENAPALIRSQYGELGEYFYDVAEGLDNDGLIESSRSEVINTSNQVFKMIYEGAITPKQMLDTCEDYMTEVQLIYKAANEG